MEKHIDFSSKTAAELLGFTYAELKNMNYVELVCLRVELQRRGLTKQSQMPDLAEYLRPRTIVGRFGGAPTLRQVPFNVPEKT